MTRIPTVLVVACATGCYSPEVPVGSDGGTSSGGSTGGPSSAGVAASDDGSEAESTGRFVSSSGTEDGPGSAPRVTIRLDGQAEPGAVNDHAVVTIDADVMDDDNDVVQVEFFLGESSLGVVMKPPFETQVALSSVDTGLRTFRALATDGSRLTAEDALEVSINIAGGNVEDVQRNMFEGALVVAGPYAIGGGVAAHDSRVYLSAVNSDGTGSLLSLIEEFDVQWTREFRLS